MRKIFSCFLCLFVALALSCSYDDGEIKERLDDLDNKVTELERQVKALNSDVSALRDLISGNRFISDVTTNSDGSYILTMVTSSGETSTITIKNGADGKSPALAVKKDTDGLYYWTLDGEWILVDGKKLPASGSDGVTPKFKIDNNYWYVSYDDGGTWTECGKASYDSSIFKSVSVSEDGKQAIVTLADGTVLTFDLYTGFGISFDKSMSQVLRVGETIAIPFTLTGADDKTQIETLPSGTWKAVVERNGDTGEIKVTAPADSQTGKVVVLVNDGGTKTIMRTLTFVAGILDVTTSSNQVPSGGGTVTAHVETDLDFEVSIPQEAADWITLPPKSRGELHTETVTLHVGANTQAEERKASVELVCNGVVVETILIYQLPYYDPAAFVVKIQAQASLANTVYLPLYGAVDATIDWGDGSTEPVKATISTAAALVQHVYAEPGVYCVSVKGSVEKLNGRQIKTANQPAIAEVVQWGQLGLKSLENAFYGDKLLEAVVAPDPGAFAEVIGADNMFYNCIALTKVPETLFSGAGKLTSIGSLFYGCTGLTDVPERLFAELSEVTSAASLFYNCSSLTSIPAGIFRDCTKLDNLSSAFSGTALTSVPADLFNGLTVLDNMAGIFSNVVTLEELPENLFRDLTAVTNIPNMFKGCKLLSKFPATLLQPLVGAENMASLFSGCISLDNLPAGFFDKQVNATACGYLFEGCKKMTTFPSLKACVSLKTVNAIWKDCTAMVTAPSDFFPENVKNGFTLAYMFQGCTSLKNVPGDLFDNFTGDGIIISDMFNGCSALESLPVGIFDKVKNIKTAGTTFVGCTSFTGESPYTTVTIDGAPVKIHLYDRGNYPDLYPTAVTSFKDCFKGCTKFADYADIPIAWGGISDGTKAAPTLKLSIEPVAGKEYYQVVANIKSTEVKSGKCVVVSKALLAELLNDLGSLDKVCNRYGVAYPAAAANSTDGATIQFTTEANMDYVFVVSGTNAHGTTVEQKEVKTAAWPAGEANFERYLGNWTVTSASSEKNKAPQTFDVRIEPYRVNESFRVYGWGITTMGEENPFIMNYTNGSVVVPTDAYQGMIGFYYVYLTCRFFDVPSSSYLVWKPSLPLISGDYNAANNQITLTGKEFTNNGTECTVSGWDYFLYSQGYFEHPDLFKPGYTISDYSIGPYTMTKSAPSSVVRAKAASFAIPLGAVAPAAGTFTAPVGTAKVVRK